MEGAADQIDLMNPGLGSIGLRERHNLLGEISQRHKEMARTSIGHGQHTK